MATALELSQLVGAQVSALIEAEIEASEETWRFIENVGFRRNEKDRLELQMVTFDMVRRDTDGKDRVHTIQIPVLTLVPLPLLTIEEANVEFDLNVVGVEEAKTKTDPKTKNGLPKLIDRKRHKLVTNLARTTKQDTRTAADLKVSVRMGQSDLPSGIEQLLNAADLGVRDETNE